MNIYFKKTVFILLIIFFQNVYSQKKNGLDKINISNWEILADKCIAINDWNGYIIANNMLSIINPLKDTLYKKNILYGYFQNNQAETCFLLSKELSSQYKHDITFLEFYAQSADVLRKYGDASIGYEKLYFFTQKPSYGYLLANAQYYLGRYLECLQTIQTLKAKDECKNEFLDFTLNNSDEKQKVPISAALYNLEGMAYFEMKDFEKCKTSFEKAINVFPEFNVAKGNLESISSSNQRP